VVARRRDADVTVFWSRDLRVSMEGCGIGTFWEVCDASDVAVVVVMGVMPEKRQSYCLFRECGVAASPKE